MTAVIAALKIRVSIGGQSWTQCYDSFSAGVPQRSPSGLLPITGKLSLAPSRPPESMDPRINRDRWRRGQSVNIDILDGGSWVRHEFGTLFILKTPSLYQPDANLELEIGCMLALRSVSAPSDDKSGVALGSNTSRSAIINNLLAAANAPALITTIDAYPIGYPLPKTEGSYIEQAGKVAYSALKYLWQNNAGQIVALDGAISPSATPVKTVRIGSGESSYSGTGGEEIPCEKYRTAGTGTQLTSNYETQTDYSEDYGPVSAIDPSLSGFVTIRTVSSTTIIDSNGNRNTEVIQETGSATYSITAPKQYGLVWRSATNSRQYFSGDRLAKEEKLTLSPLEAIAPAYIEGLPEGERFSVGHSEALTRDITEYFYDGTNKVKKIVQTTYKPAAAVVLGQATWNSGQALLEVTASQYTQEWIKMGPGYRKRETRSEAQVSEKENGATKTVTIALVTVNTTTSTVSGDQNQPPATQNRPGTHTQKEVPLKGEAKFQIAPSGDESERTRDPQIVDYAVSNAQLDAIARMEGAILIGRSQAHSIQVPYFSAKPLDIWSIREIGGNTATYQMDGLEYSHVADQAIVGGEGIWLATTDAGTGTLVVPYQPIYTYGVARQRSVSASVIPFDTTLPITPVGSIVRRRTVSMRVEITNAIISSARQRAVSGVGAVAPNYTGSIVRRRNVSGAGSIAPNYTGSVIRQKLRSGVSGVATPYSASIVRQRTASGSSAAVPNTTGSIVRQRTASASVVVEYYLAETMSWRSRVRAKGSDVSTAGMDAVDTFLRALATASISSKVDLIQVYAGITSFAGLPCPVRHPTNADATLTNFSSGNYTASGSGAGLQGANGRKVNHNYDINTYHAGQSFLMGAYVRNFVAETISGDYDRLCGATGGGKSWYIDQYANDGYTQLGSSQMNNSYTPGTGDGFFAMSRVSDTDCRYWSKGAQRGSTQTSTNTETASGIGSFHSFASNFGSNTEETKNKLLIVIAGDGLTTSELASLDSALATLSASLSA